MRRIIIFSFLFMLLCGQAFAQTGNIKVVVKGIKVVEGSLLASIFNSEEGFPEDAKKSFSSLTVKLTENPQSFYFKNIPFGTYALAVVHDKNNNGAFDKNFLGIPKEGYGVSNNIKGLSAPGFKEASFRIDSKELVLELDLIHF
jgi:uncharacterized protein (DUF2141 family)